MLNVQNLSIRFGNGPEVASDVTFSLNKNDRFIIIGETGSGKSVLLLAALRLLPRTAHVTGEIMLEDKDLLLATKKEMNRLLGVRISYIPQGSGNGLNPLYTIGHQLCEMISRRQKLPRAAQMDEAARFLAHYGFEDPRGLCKAYPFMLSGGMRQRALIAMAVAAEAELILADEPTKGLDSHRIEMVVESFHSLYDRTILCVTHDIRFAKSVGTKIAVVYASNIVEIADSADFFEKPLHPYSQAMLEALPENGLCVKSGFAPPREGEDSDCCRFYKRCHRREERCLKKPPMTELDGRKVRCWCYAD